MIKYFNDRILNAFIHLMLFIILHLTARKMMMMIPAIFIRGRAWNARAFPRKSSALIIENLNRMGQSLGRKHRSRVNHNLGTAIHRIKLSLFVRESPRSVRAARARALAFPSLFHLFDFYPSLPLWRRSPLRGLFFRESQSLSKTRWVSSNGSFSYPP